MFGQFEDFPHEESKGLFTFYREQAQNEEQLRKKKRERKLAKRRSAQGKNMRGEQEERNKQQMRQVKQTEKKQEEQKKQSDKDRKSLHEPRNRREKFHHSQVGSSVVIINAKNGEHRLEHSHRAIEQKSSLKKIQQLINPYNNNRYFLQNKQIPASFGKISLEKLVVKNEQQESESAQRKNVVKPSYFNQFEPNQRKYIPAFSYDKLPELLRSRPSHSEMIFPKRYKSKRIEAALKSNNSDLIRQIRESLKEESLLEKISYVDANQGISNEPMSEQLEYQKRLNSRLDAKQRRLIDIIRNSCQFRKHKYLG